MIIRVGSRAFCTATNITSLVKAARSACQNESSEDIARVSKSFLGRLHQATDSELPGLLTAFRRARAPPAFWALAAAEAAPRIAASTSGDAAQLAFDVAFGAITPRQLIPVDEDSLRELWGRVVERLTAGDSGLTALGTASAAFAHARHPDPDFFRHAAVSVSKASEERADTVKPDTMSWLAGAFARLGADLSLADRRTFWLGWARILATHGGLRERWPKYSSRSLAVVADGLARSDVEGEVFDGAAAALATILLDGGADRLRELNEWGLSASWAALCRTSACEQACDAILDEVQRRTPNIRPRGVALLLNAFAGRGIGSSSENMGKRLISVTEALADAIVADLGDGSAAPRDAANALDALGRLRCKHEKVLLAMDHYIPARIETFNPRDTVGVAVAYGRLDERNEPVLITLASHLCRDLNRFSFSQLSSVATAFARTRVRETRFLQRLVLRCQQLSRGPTPTARDAVAVLSALGRLQVANDEAFAGLGESLHVRDLEPSDLREVALGYARARWAFRPLLADIADAAASEKEPVPLDVAGTILCCLARLRWQHLPLQRTALRAALFAETRDVAAATGEATLSLGDWARILHSATLLDTAHAGWVERELWYRCCLALAERLCRHPSDDVSRSAHEGLPTLPSWVESLEGDSPKESRAENESGCEDKEVVTKKPGAPLGPHVSEVLFCTLTVAALAARGEHHGEVPAEFGRGLSLALGMPPWAPRGALAHALLLGSDGAGGSALDASGLVDALPTLLIAVTHSGLMTPGRADAALEDKHMPGLAGRALTKEAQAVGNLLARIGGPEATLPLRQPWVARPADLGVHLLLGADWQPDEGAWDLDGSALKSVE